MFNNSDLTFITNENGQNLLERFKVLVKDTELFDVLVGYFYTSGFYKLYNALEKTKKIRILIGISTNKKTVELIEKAKQPELQFSHMQTKGLFSNLLISEMNETKDKREVEEGILKFLEWIKSGKLEIKAYPTENLHAKLYIMTFPVGDRDVGRVITGSSNFTQAGLVDNLEFNVELKNRADYEFSKAKFAELWSDAVDVKDNYIQTILQKTWLNDTITPYQLYLKFLYEYFNDELYQTNDFTFKYAPTRFKQLEYQKQAVLNAKKILEGYGGVFLSDVVGLGKTYVSAMLASQLEGRTLVLAPPILLEKTNPGSWLNVFLEFHVPSADFVSLGKLDQLIQHGSNQYKNIFIDESHKFRTETNITYEKLAQICRGKRVVLVTATPFNNTPRDILSQIKLFQNARKSTIPNISNLEAFFVKLEQKINKLDRQRDNIKYMQTMHENAKEIREKVLKYIMIRRTRKEIETYFADDLQNQNLKFPEIESPEAVFYQLNKEENEIFDKTVVFITQNFKYSRYTPILYYKEKNKLDWLEIQSQKNMGKFMKILLVKRLESSFYAFKNTINRFISYYELFLKKFNEGDVYISKRYANKLFQLLESDDDEAIQKLIENDKVKRYPAKDFDENLKKDLENDIFTLKEIQNLWNNINRDPKLLAFIDILTSKQILKENKIIIFSESKETVEYLAKNLEEKFPNKTLYFSGSSNAALKEKVIENFDALSPVIKNDYRILIATEILSEGVNLHQSNVIINYDIPWNPTRLMQRVGRVNRVNTTFDKIYTFNFFPTEQSNDQIKLKESAESKIQAFITLLGSDAQILTEGESIESHELFNHFTSKTILTNEDGEESELKYFHIIKKIRDTDIELFNKIKQLPKKARTAKKYIPIAPDDTNENLLLTYFQKGRLQKFFITGNSNTKEIDFITAAKILESNAEESRQNLGTDFYEKLERNKQAFEFSTNEEYFNLKNPLSGGDNAINILKILKFTLKNNKSLAEDQIDYCIKIIQQLEHGAIPKQTIRTIKKAFNKQKKCLLNPNELITILRNNIPSEFLENHIVENTTYNSEPRRVILSEYLVKNH